MEKRQAQSPQTKCSTRCSNHVFHLAPLQSNLHFSRPATVKFCPKSNKYWRFQDRNQQKNDCIIPMFNRDQKHYTRAFILPIDRGQQEDDDNRLRAEHEEKVREALNSGREMWLPKPSRKYRYCGVCKCDYEDYIKHIKDQGHKNCIRKSKYNSFILDTAAQFQNQPMVKAMSDTTTISSKGPKPTEVIDLEQEQVVIDRPVKKRKVQSAFVSHGSRPQPLLQPPYQQQLDHFWTQLINYRCLAMGMSPYDFNPYMPYNNLYLQPARHPIETLAMISSTFNNM